MKKQTLWNSTGWNTEELARKVEREFPWDQVDFHDDRDIYFRVLLFTEEIEMNGIPLGDFVYQKDLRRVAKIVSGYGMKY